MTDKLSSNKKHLLSLIKYNKCHRNNQKSNKLFRKFEIILITNYLMNIKIAIPISILLLTVVIITEIYYK